MSQGPRPRNRSRSRWLALTGLPACVALLVAWVAPSAFAEAPYWGAAVPVLGDSQVYVNAAAATSDGHVMVVGILDNNSTSAIFPTGPDADDSIVLPPQGPVGGWSTFVARYDVARSAFDWATIVGGTGSVSARSIALTADDTVFIAGELEGTAYFPSGPNADDSIPLTSLGDRGTFVVAMNPGEGVFSWGRFLGGPGTGQSYQSASVSVSDGGDLTVTGAFRGTGYFPRGPLDDSIALSQLGSYEDAFIARIDAATTYVTSVQQIPGPWNFDWASRLISVGGTDDSTVVAGNFYQSTAFSTGPAVDDSIVLTAPGFAYNAFVGALRDDGSSFAWVRQFTSLTGEVQVTSMARTSIGRLAVTGFFSAQTSFPTGPNADDSIVLTPSGSADAYVAMFNADDSYVDWVMQAGSGATDSDNNPGGVEVQSRRIMVTSDDTLIISGYLDGLGYFPTGPATDDSLALSTTGYRDTFVVALSADDSYVSWGRTTRGASNIDAYASAVTSDDSIVVAGGFGTFHGPAEFPTGPAADDSVALLAGGTGNGFVAVLGAVPVPSGSPTPPTPPSPPSSPPGSSPGSPEPVPVPPNAPEAVVATAADNAVSVAWGNPVVSGSFPISSYQAMVDPGGYSCLAAAPALTCTITGLTNGTAYTATVRALNGAGWSSWSDSSAVVTPQPAVVPSIMITGTRGEVRGKPGVVVSGTTTGFGMGAILRPWIRFPGQTAYTQGTASILVDVQGGVTWERRTGKAIYISLRSADGEIHSNRLIMGGR